MKIEKVSNSLCSFTLHIILIFFVANLGFAQEKFRNKPWKEHRPFIEITTNGKLLSFPQYMSVGFEGINDLSCVRIVPPKGKTINEYKLIEVEKIRENLKPIGGYNLADPDSNKRKLAQELDSLLTEYNNSFNLAGYQSDVANIIAEKKPSNMPSLFPVNIEDWMKLTDNKFKKIEVRLKSETINNSKEGCNCNKATTSPCLQTIEVCDEKIKLKDCLKKASLVNFEIVETNAYATVIDQLIQTFAGMNVVDTLGKYNADEIDDRAKFYLDKSNDLNNLQDNMGNSYFKVNRGDEEGDSITTEFFFSVIRKHIVDNNLDAMIDDINSLATDELKQLEVTKVFGKLEPKRLDNFSRRVVKLLKNPIQIGLLKNKYQTAYREWIRSKNYFDQVSVGANSIMDEYNRLQLSLLWVDRNVKDHIFKKYWLSHKKLSRLKDSLKEMEKQAALPIKEMETKIAAMDKMMDGGSGSVTRDFQDVPNNYWAIKKELEERKEALDSLKSEINGIESGILAFKKLYLNKEKVLYKGLFYLSSKDKTIMMRNHDASNEFKTLPNQRKIYYEHEDIHYLAHNFKGNLSKYRLEPTGEAITDHKPTWVDDVVSQIDALDGILATNVPDMVGFSKSLGIGAIKLFSPINTKANPHIEAIQTVNDTKELLQWLHDNEDNLILLNELSIFKTYKSKTTLGQTVELKEKDRSFSLPAKVSYSIKEYKSETEVKKSFDFSNAYNHYRLKRVQLQAGFIVSISPVERLQLDESSTNLDPTIETNPLQFVTSVKVYPWKTDLDDNKLLLLHQRRANLIAGVSIPSPLENVYLGFGYDLVPGLNLNFTTHLYKDFNYKIENGVVAEKRVRYRHAPLAVGVGVDLEIFTKTIKLLFK